MPSTRRKKLALRDPLVQARVSLVYCSSASLRHDRCPIHSPRRALKDPGSNFRLDVLGSAPMPFCGAKRLLTCVLVMPLLAGFLSGCDALTEPNRFQVQSEPPKRKPKPAASATAAAPSPAVTAAPTAPPRPTARASASASPSASVGVSASAAPSSKAVVPSARPAVPSAPRPAPPRPPSPPSAFD